MNLLQIVTSAAAPCVNLLIYSGEIDFGFASAEFALSHFLHMWLIPQRPTNRTSRDPNFLSSWPDSLGCGSYGDRTESPCTTPLTSRLWFWFSSSASTSKFSSGNSSQCIYNLYQMIQFIEIH